MRRVSDIAGPRVVHRAARSLAACLKNVSRAALRAFVTVAIVSLALWVSGVARLPPLHWLEMAYESWAMTLNRQGHYTLAGIVATGFATARTGILIAIVYSSLGLVPRMRPRNDCRCRHCRGVLLNLTEPTCPYCNRRI